MLGMTVRALAPDQIRSAFPLIREVMPGIDLATWADYARRVTSRGKRAGIMAAWREGRAFPCGLFCYRVDKALGRGKVLIAEYFVAVDLLDPQGVLEALVAELDELGQRLGCSAVRSVVHGGEKQVAGGLVAAGHAPEASLLLKAIAGHPGGHRNQPPCVPVS
jgi:hypothetical protein